jgi:hypothetical protein
VARDRRGMVTQQGGGGVTSTADGGRSRRGRLASKGGGWEAEARRSQRRRGGVRRWMSRGGWRHGRRSGVEEENDGGRTIGWLYGIILS